MLLVKTTPDFFTHNKEVFTLKETLARRMMALAVCSALAFTLPAAARFTAPEEPPAVAAFSKNGPVTGAISFSAEDFRATGGTLNSIVLTSLPDPAAGVLTMADQLIPEGSEIAMAAVDGLVFSPLATPMLSSTSFSFTPVFADGSQGEDVEVGLFLLSGPNGAPVCADLNLVTYKDVEVQGTFAGVDPEGDLLTFQLVSKPARGAVTLAQDGSANFTYTPYEGKTGKDAFTYVAVDALGNTSAPATVSIKIEKQKTKVTYSDMTNVEGHREAVRLAEAGVLIGEKMGDEYFFHPELAMSRAQFTALALDCAGLEPLEAVTLTGFADDEVMAAWAKPYVSSALRAGVVTGSYDGAGQVVFLPDEPITAAEAAVVLNRAIRVTDVRDDDLPTWYSQSVANLNSCGALPASAVLTEPLNRAQAAVMLSGALDVMEGRESGGWLQW